MYKIIQVRLEKEKVGGAIRKDRGEGKKGRKPQPGLPDFPEGQLFSQHCSYIFPAFYPSLSLRSIITGDFIVVYLHSLFSFHLFILTSFEYFQSYLKDYSWCGYQNGSQVRTWCLTGECFTTQQHYQTSPGMFESDVLQVGGRLFFGGKQEFPSIIMKHFYSKVPTLHQFCRLCTYSVLSRSLEKEGLCPLHRGVE